MLTIVKLEVVLTVFVFFSSQFGTYPVFSKLGTIKERTSFAQIEMLNITKLTVIYLNYSLLYNRIHLLKSIQKQLFSLLFTDIKMQHKNVLLKLLKSSSSKVCFLKMCMPAAFAFCRDKANRQKTVYFIGNYNTMSATSDRT